MGTVKRIRQLFKLSVLSIFLGALPVQMANAVDDPISAGGSQTQTTRHGGLGTTDSTALDKRENPRIMQPMTSAIPASSVGIYGFGDADNFVANIANKCTPDTTLPVCFTRVSVTVVGSTIPNGGATCPDGYETLMNYGTGVMLDSTGERVYQYAADVRLWTSLAQWNWYWGQGYHLEVCPTWERWVIKIWADTNKDGGVPFWGGGFGPDGRPDSNRWPICTSADRPPCDAVIPADHSNIRIESNSSPDSYYVGYAEANTPATCWKECFTWGPVPMDCGNNVAGNWTRWHCDVQMLCRSMVRPAGFYTAPANNDYPLSSTASDIAPTIKICGKKQLIWREKE